MLETLNENFSQTDLAFGYSDNTHQPVEFVVTTPQDFGGLDNSALSGVNVTDVI